jgi:Na+-driven multidrug efflux pump
MNEMQQKSTNSRTRKVWENYPTDYMLLILVAWLLPAIYGLFNRYFIGFMAYESIVTEQSFEALEVIMEVFLEMFPLSVLALVAKKMMETKNVVDTVKTAFIMQAFITSLFVVINYFLAPYFIDWINTPEASKELALNYFRVRALALPFSSLGLIMVISIRSMRKGWIAVLVAAIGLLINIILDVLFISNFSFSLKLGLMGSAWNNVIANACMLIVSSAVFFRIVKADARLSFTKKPAQNILAIGKWNGLESLVRNLGYIIGVVAVVNFVGANEPEAIGGYNTAMWVMWGITLIPVMSWTEATQIAIGNAYGKRELGAMKDIQKVSTAFLFLYMICWLIIGNFYWIGISRWLNQGVSDEVAQYSTITFYYLIGPYIIYAVGSGLKTIFIGTGRPLYVLIPSAIVNICIYIPFGLAVKYGLIQITYVQFLIVTIFVFAGDFLMTVAFLIKKGYTNLDFNAFE